MKHLLLVVAFCSGLYAQSEYISYMPKAMLDFDSMVSLPKEPAEILNPALHDFKTELIDSGMICKKKYALLISEKKAADLLFYQYGYERQMKELKMAKYLLNIHDSMAVAVERNIYWKALKDKDLRITQLEKSNQRNWFERNNIWIGAVLGVAVAVITEYAVLQTYKK
jgi:hypothetical protein